MALQMGELEIKIKANLDELQRELENINAQEDIEITATVDVDDSAITDLEDNEYTVTVDTEADTAQAYDDIEEVEEGDYDAEIDADADVTEAETNIGEITDGDYEATVETDATDDAALEIDEIAGASYDALITTDATDDAYNEITAIADDDYAAEIDAEADTEDASDKLDDTANPDGNPRVAKIKAVAEGVVEVAKELFELASGAASYGDDVLTKATEMGITVQQYQELLYSEGKLDVTVSEWEALYKAFFNLTSTNSDDFVNAMNSLKINPGEYNGDYFSMMIDVISALENYDGDDENNIFGMIFNGRTLETANKLVGNMEKVTELADEANTTGFVKTDEELAKMGTLADALDDLRNSWTSFKTEIGTYLAPAVTEAVNTITPIFQELTAILHDGEITNEEATNLGTELGNAFISVLNTAFDVGGGLLVTLANALPATINGIDWATVVKSALSTLGTVVETLITDIDWLNVFTEICKGLGEGVYNGMPNWIKKVLDFLGLGPDSGTTSTDPETTNLGTGPVGELLDGGGKSNGVGAGREGLSDPILVTFDDDTELILSSATVDEIETAIKDNGNMTVNNDITVNVDRNDNVTGTGTTEVDNENANASTNNSFANGAGRGR